MNSSPNSTFIPVDEYLSTCYRPDLEYVDGVLVERGDPTMAHGVLQATLAAHFEAHCEDHPLQTLINVRMRIVERARYRIPDLMLCPVPLPEGKICTSVPWAVVEILSPEDNISDQLTRFRDFQQIGVRHVALLDPEKYVAFRFEEATLTETQFTSLDLPSGSVPFDTTAIFQQLRERRNRGR